MLFYTAIIFIMRVDGFFIPCETQEDCKVLDEFGLHMCKNKHCITEDYFLEDYMMPATASPTATAPTTVTVPTTVTA